ncbi:hypothetical protein ACFHWD_14365 [Clostridium sp. MT-14]|uniref:hypothetical protein n=1 Tax=Clostridium sp. MT-14 TaxID=3348360 RepID=UPI0035F473BC
MEYSQKYIQKLTKTLTQKELDKINKYADKAISELEESYISIGNPLNEEDIEILSKSIREALEHMKICNKLKYTPKKYRKNNKLFDSVH